MLPLKHDISFRQGSTHREVARWGREPFLFVAITAMLAVAPVKITTAAPHALPDGWNVAVVGAQGMTELNAQNNPPKNTDFKRATVVDPSNIEFNAISAVNFGAYRGGGFLQFYTPQSLDGYTARMLVKDSAGGRVLLTLTTENGRIDLDDATKTITLIFEAADTEGVDWRYGIYDLELVSASGEVTPVMAGCLRITTEITTAII